MKKFLNIAFAALFALGVAVMPAKAQDASATTGLKIAVVDIQALLKSTKGAQSIESQLETIRKGFQSEVEKEEKTLRDSEKAILDKKAEIGEEEFKKKAAEFQQKVAEGQKRIQDRKGKLDKALAVAIGKLRTEIVKVVAGIGETKKLDLVLARTDVVIVAKQLDITQEVLEKVDASLPSIKVEVE